jgi:pyruvate formate lyase activating enzyme
MIKSVIWSSMIDYPDNISTTLFTGTCNFDCEYCYNKGLIKEKNIDFEKEILPKLLERKDFINHIIISGGECTIQEDFIDLVETLYNNGFKIGLHTNGYEPEILEAVIDKLDYIGMDIKNDFENYDVVAKRKVDIEKIKKSVDLILKSKVNYEFRTTVYPKFIGERNLINIANYLKEVGCKEFVIQKYFDHDRAAVPYTNSEMEKFKNSCNNIIPTKLRGL